MRNTKVPRGEDPTHKGDLTGTRESLSRQGEAGPGKAILTQVRQSSSRQGKPGGDEANFLEATLRNTVSQFPCIFGGMALSAQKIQRQDSKFHQLLQEQVGNEFTASQQYIAVAVWFDNEDLPRLAAHFYRQALEERNHAMMIVQYLMDNDVQVTVPGIEPVRNEFTETRELVALALEQEREVTTEITNLARAAREEGDYIGEQFMQWFLKEQVEEVSQMSTLLNIVDRAKGNLFHVEAHLDREHVGDDSDPTAPSTAGGAV